MKIFFNGEFSSKYDNTYYNDMYTGVGGIEAEAVMLGQTISMVLPKVVGYKLIGNIGKWTTSTDVVLTITKVSVCVSVCLSVS